MAVVLCPKCQGQKHVQTPPWVAGDGSGTYAASGVRLYTCPVCAGVGVLDTDAVSGAAERQRLARENAAMREIVSEIAFVDDDNYQEECPFCREEPSWTAIKHTDECPVTRARAFVGRNLRIEGKE